MLAERRLLIGCLSAHVTAATVHVLSRVSPVTLALKAIINLISTSVAHFLPVSFLFFHAFMSFSLICLTACPPPPSVFTSQTLSVSFRHLA